MKLIVGLGNPGTQYMTTRHNIGFEAVDTLAELKGIAMQKNKFKSIIGEGTIGGEKVILMKPQTYMNLSGEALRACMDWHKLTSEDILVIYDDVSLEVGQLRIRKSGSAGGHNGIKSIISHLGGQEFLRIKVGVGEKPAGWDLANYVLGRLSEEEMKVLGPKLKDICDAIEMILIKGPDQAMNTYNLKMKR
ncbi:aminoacyl-tRNA hydrolase [Sporanaerobium hydrogeniformans]|uniref:Aminoacyl-tRNA hydrolase n=1 Tax=Sporanaerobium hydrogeniformans TaxID=3072179 RepID=A0AC61DC99_9FIRM|nr:aminoacyl-tRNA hydrolase [Sporanaerobium hydrogeniformans]PHV70373.1 aminoacyl-tRNA hydrolase [Sporanaerobium hydrogeniformans]